MDIASPCFEMERYPDAGALLVEAVRVAPGASGKYHEITKASVSNLIEPSETWNKPEEAEGIKPCLRVQKLAQSMSSRDTGQVMSTSVRNFSGSFQKQDCPDGLQPTVDKNFYPSLRWSF